MRGLRTTWVTLAALAAVSGALTAAVLQARTTGEVPANETAVALAVATYTVVALVVEHARPGHLVGRLLLFGATAWGVGEASLALGVKGYLHDPGSVPAADWFAVLGTAVRGLGWLVLVLAVPLVFPDGELPWRGRRWPMVLLVSAIGAFTAASVLAPEPLEYRLEGMDSPTGVPESLSLAVDGLALSALGLCVLTLVVAISGLVHRWRAGDELRRQQLLWLSVAFAVPVAFLPLIATDLVSPWMFAVVTLPVPVAITVAMLQRRLYDVQLAVSRTLTYAALSAVVAGVYALTVGGVGALLRERGAPWLPWVAAGVVAVSFAPLRNALQRGVTRLTYGSWSQPADVLATTGRRLADASDVPGLLDTLVHDLGATLGLRYVAVHGASGHALAVHGAPSASGEVERLPLMAYGEPVGALSWSHRTLRDTDRGLLADLAGQLGGVVHAAGLLDSVRDAQHRLVLAREEERRRLRRDLHDGLGPALAGLTLHVDALRNRIRLEDTDPDAELVRLRSAIADTVLDVRRIVEGLRPPALDDLGLEGALEQVADRLGNAVHVDLDVEPLPPLPAAVEVAVYRVVAEALANVARHSGTTRATVRVSAQPGAVRAEIVDDGHGGAEPRDGGVGLGSMRERAEELGGTLTVDSRAGAGTRVHLHLPVEAARPVPDATTVTP